MISGSVLWSAHSLADITGQELLTTCARALGQHYTGLDAAMCDWYVKPCAVCGVDAPHQAWCIPANTTSATLAKLVTQEISTHPANASKSVKPLVQEILAAHFPCANVQK